MAKGRDKPGRDKKKPKQDKAGVPKSAYAQSMASPGSSNAGAMSPGKKK